MPFIRLSDNYIDHPKFLALSADAFRLWHEGMAFCRKHQTDGLISAEALQGFRYYAKAPLEELLKPCALHLNPLWLTVDLGYQVYGYLEWNPSKKDEDKHRRAARSRMRKIRGKGGGSVRANSARTNSFVPDRIGSDLPLEKESEKKPLKLAAPEARPNRVNSRSNHPIFKGNRLIVFDWQLENLANILGPFTEMFDLHAWFYDLDLEIASKDFVMLPRDGGKWLEQQLLKEATRRKLPIGDTAQQDEFDAKFPTAWLCEQCREIHEGTKAQARERLCLKKVS